MSLKNETNIKTSIMNFLMKLVLASALMTFFIISTHAASVAPLLEETAKFHRHLSFNNCTFSGNGRVTFVFATPQVYKESGVKLEILDISNTESSKYEIFGDFCFVLMDPRSELNFVNTYFRSVSVDFLSVTEGTDLRDFIYGAMGGSISPVVVSMKKGRLVKKSAKHEPPQGAILSIKNCAFARDENWTRFVQIHNVLVMEQDKKSRLADEVEKYQERCVEKNRDKKYKEISGEKNVFPEPDPSGIKFAEVLAWEAIQTVANHSVVHKISFEGCRFIRTSYLFPSAWIQYRGANRYDLKSALTPLRQVVKEAEGSENIFEKALVDCSKEVEVDKTRLEAVQAWLESIREYTYLLPGKYYAEKEGEERCRTYEAGLEDIKAWVDSIRKLTDKLPLSRTPFLQLTGAGLKPTSKEDCTSFEYIL